MKLKLKTNNTKQNIDFFFDKMFPKKAIDIYLNLFVMSRISIFLL